MHALKQVVGALDRSAPTLPTYSAGVQMYINEVNTKIVHKLKTYRNSEFRGLLQFPMHSHTISVKSLHGYIKTRNEIQHKHNSNISYFTGLYLRTHIQSYFSFLVEDIDMTALVLMRNYF